MSQKKPKTYKQIKEVWYKKLEKSGFKDIEKNEYRLKTYSKQLNKTKKLKDYESTRDYYYMVNQFLGCYKFKNKLEQVIWEYYSLGMSARKIAKILRKVKVSIKPNKDNVALIIKRLVEEMKKMYVIGYND